MTKLISTTTRARVGVLLITMAAFVASSRLTTAQTSSRYSLTMQAYRQAVGALVSALQQSDKPAASDALLTVIAVHRSLTRALETDRVRLQAASRREDFAEATVLTQLADAMLERIAQTLFAAQWVATADPDSRQLAIEHAASAITMTETATNGLAPLVDRTQGTSIPAALLLEATATRNANGTFVVLVTVSNVGDEAADRVRLTLQNDDTLGGQTQELQLGTLAPGVIARHVFGVAVPNGVTAATGTVEAVATNANAEVFALEFAPTP